MAIKPIKRYGLLTPTGVDPTVGNRMKALAGIADGVRGLAVGVGKAKAESEAPLEALKEAREAIEEGRPVEKRGVLEWGSAQYNQVAQAAYQKSLNVDVQDALQKAQALHPDNLDKYQQVANESIKGLLGNVDEETRFVVSEYYNQANADVVRQINSAAKKKSDNQIAANLLAGALAEEDTISNLYRNGDFDSGDKALLSYAADLQSGVDAGVLNAESVVQKIETLKDTIAIQSKLGELDRTLLSEDLPTAERLQQAQVFVDSLKKSGEIADLSAAQKDSLIQTLEARVQDEAMQYTAEQNQLSSAEMLRKADLVQSIKTGGISSENAFAEIDAMFKEGLISSEEELIKYRNYVNDQFTSNMTKQQNINNTIAAINGNPTSEPLTQGAVDDYYETVLPNLPSDPMAREVVQAELVAGTRYVPTDMKTEFRNNLVSGDAALVKSAANTMDRILQIPGMGNEFTRRETVFAEQVAFNMEYMDAEKAIANANDQTNPANASMVEARRKYLDDNKKSFENKYADEIEGEFTGWFQDFNANSIGGSQMVADYKELVESYFLAGSTEEGAKNKAMANMKANWTNSSFGLMRNAPELYYSVNGSVEYIKDNIYNALKDEYAAQGVEFEKSGIFLQSDDTTSRLAAKGKPDYSVVILTNDETLLRPSFIAEDGTVFDRWNPTDEYQAMLQSEKARIKQEGEKTLYNRPDQQRTFQTIAKELGFDNAPKEHTGGRFKGGSAELDEKFRTTGIAESLDVLGSALDQVTYTPLEMLEDVSTKIKRQSDNYVAKIKRNQKGGQ